MNTLRRFYFAWGFAIVSVSCIFFSLMRVAALVSRHRGLPHASALVSTALSLLIAAIFGMAWWTVWMEKARARIWGVAVCLMGLSAPLSSFFLLHRQMTESRWGILILNVFGLVAFLWPDKQMDENAGEFSQDAGSSSH
jgi:drug/metabolite transporter (DMT)-like permease